MAVNTPPNGVVLQNATMNAQVLRQLFAATIASSGGVVDAGGYAVTQNGTPNMSVNVAAGRAWVPGNAVGNITGFSFNTQGMYFALNDATVNLAIAAANATNPRIDIVVLQVLDSQYSGTSNLAQLAVVTGTAAASPVAPAAPSNSITLAQIAVAANATSITSSNITDTRVYSAPLASQSAQGRKNALMNAVGFPINQRAAASYSATGYTCDRWYYTLGAAAAGTIGVAAPSPGHVPGFIKNYVAWNRTTAGTANSTWEQRIESVSTFAGETVTMSILCDTASGSVDFVPSLVQNFGTGGTPSAAVTTTGQTLTATTTLQTLTATFTVPSIAGKTLGTAGNDYLSQVITRAFNATNGATGQLNIYAIQLELGSAGTAWEVPSVQESLAQCQRFYHRFDLTAVSNALLAGMGIAQTASVGYFNLSLDVTMRAAPTFGSAAAGNFQIVDGLTGTTLTGLALTGSTPDTAWLQCAVSGGLTVNRPFWFQRNSTATPAYLEFSADL